MATRRCTQQQFLLRPDPITNQVVGYSAGYTQGKYGFKLHALACLSNHLHDVLTDTSNKAHSDIPNIKRDFHSMVARALNTVRGRSENLWSLGESETYNFLASSRLEDISKRIEYGILNFAESGLVRTYKDWPGLVLLPAASGKPRVYRFRRPSVFFSSSMPEFVDLVVEPPDCDDPAKFMQDLMRNIATREREIQQKFARAGRGFLGPKRVLRQHPNDRPGNTDPSRTRKPQFATEDRDWRLQQILNKWRWDAEYRRCREAFKAGDRDVEFPLGTFKLVAYYGARSRDGPPE